MALSNEVGTARANAYTCANSIKDGDLRLATQAQVSATLALCEALDNVVGLLETLDVDINNGLVAISNELE